MGETVETAGAIQKAKTQLPLWRDQVRGLPNAFARSALFCIGSRSARRKMSNVLITSVRGSSVTYTGEELRQDDQDVFLQLVHLARGRTTEQLQHPVKFKAYRMLKELGWPFSKIGYKRLRDCIDRLKANSLKVRFVKSDRGRPATFAGSLVRKYWTGEEDERKTTGGSPQEWEVWLEPEVVNMFEQFSFSEIEWSQRLQLDRPLSKWLHSFLTDLGLPAPAMNVDELRALSGSQAKEVKTFKMNLKEALEELKQIGFIIDFKFDEAYLFVQRSSGETIYRTRPTVRLLVSEAEEEDSPVA